ncbi:ABC transporter ATP-binding protein [Suttonella ornithocola]|uniref:ABC-type dipeptide transporter n=1 Tax=Suttonella ornithocola TaxID=279832 RepID=A0A380MYE4_9GAMM|nr:ABC transporter ATP-binding protein [Suttonella ornithocola]SUO96467.1 Glutathione import ATP-binding protein GsiA [Suttonella ornithocola]
MSLLTVDNLDITFQTAHGEVNAVRGVSFSLEKGQTLALVGESGSGKSVTAMSIVRLLPTNVTHYSDESKIIFEEVDILKAPESVLRRLRGNRIGMIFQEPMTSLNPFMTIGNQLIETVLAHYPKTSQAQAREKAVLMLERVRIKEPAKRLKQYPHEFSGGQLQRIMIAMALINEPDLLIADEPTTALDVTIQAEILDLLHDLQREMGMAIIFITHDLGLAEHYSETVCVMRLGEVVERGNIKTVFSAPEHQYTVELLNATPNGLKHPIAEDAVELLEAKNIRVEFVTERGIFGGAKAVFTAVEDISFTLKSGETLGVVGESGSGKSTLGKAVMQMLDYKGKVIFEKKNLSTLSQKERRDTKSKMQMVFQDPFGSLSPRLTIGEIIGEGLLVHQAELSGKERRERVATILEEVALSPDMINRYPHEFSGGQRQRIAIARAIILQPKFVLLDEPTSALDRSIQVKIVDLLRSLQQKYHLSYLFISHDLSVVRAMSDRVIVMQKGKVMETGTAEQIFYQPQTEYTQRLINAAFDL